MFETHCLSTLRCAATHPKFVRAFAQAYASFVKNKVLHVAPLAAAVRAALSGEIKPLTVSACLLSGSEQDGAAAPRARPDQDGPLGRRALPRSAPGGRRGIHPLAFSFALAQVSCSPASRCCVAARRRWPRACPRSSRCRFRAPSSSAVRRCLLVSVRGKLNGDSPRLLIIAETPYRAGVVRLLTRVMAKHPALVQQYLQASAAPCFDVRSPSLR